jgi:hypothetical protein
MKTICPKCKSKFNAPNEYNGKKVRCPKCREIFICVEIMGMFKAAREAKTTKNVSTKCTNCGRVIKSSEISYGINEIVVCRECNDRLRDQEKDNLKNRCYSEICFFCQERPAETYSVAYAGMYRIKGGLFTTILLEIKKLIKIPVALVFSNLGSVFSEDTVHYETQNIEIPRCEQCKTVHEEEAKYHDQCIRHGLFTLICYPIAVLGLFVGTPLSIIVFLLSAMFFLSAVSSGSFVTFLKALLYAVASGGLASLIVYGTYRLLRSTTKTVPPPVFPEGVMLWSHRAEFPKVKSLLEAGWVLGDKPEDEFGVKYIPTAEEKQENGSQAIVEQKD